MRDQPVKSNYFHNNNNNTGRFVTKNNVWNQSGEQIPPKSAQSYTSSQNTSLGDTFLERVLEKMKEGFQQQRHALKQDLDGEIGAVWKKLNFSHEQETDIHFPTRDPASYQKKSNMGNRQAWNQYRDPNSPY